MGEPLASGRFQVRGGGLTTPSLVARVVPDVTGLDRSFDYAVPEALAARAVVGSVVKVPLHGRRVKGWIIARSDVALPPAGPHGGPFHAGVLQEIIDVRGLGVAADVMEAALWSAERWAGPLRSVLVAASAPRLRDLVGRPQYAKVTEEVGATVRGSGRESRLHIAPPHRPVISLALEATSDGPVLLLCPTLEMAARGAAWLRRQGAVVAEHPREWSREAGGVDVVVGARSAVWAPVPGLRNIVVIDEHDGAYVDERSPHWDATRVAEQRAALGDSHLILSSPVPSLGRIVALDTGAIALDASTDRSPWGRMEIVDLTDASENGGVPSSLVSASLLEACRDESLRVGVVLNGRDESSTLLCTDCGTRVRCPSCASTMTVGSRSGFVCPSCRMESAGICQACGSTKIRPSRIGYRTLASSLRKALRRPVAVVSASDRDGSDGAGVFVGTEALLHRVHPLDVVVFADVDGWLSSPRLGAGERLWALAVRALRAGGGFGRLLLQTRSAGHPLLRALAAAGEGGAESYLAWARSELATRRDLALPPFAASALVSVRGGSGKEAEVVDGDATAIRAAVDAVGRSARHAMTPDGVLILADDRSDLGACLAAVRTVAPRVRIVVDPRDS